VRLCDETEWGFGWIQEERLARTSHALRAEFGTYDAQLG